MEIELTVKKEAVQAIVLETIEQVEKNNGTGKPGNPEDLDYHNLNHTYDVMNEANNLFEDALQAGKVTEADRDCVQIAAAGHDERQDLGRGLNESESAKIMRERMRKFMVFSEVEMQKVESMILATTTYFDKDGIMHQSAPEGNYLAMLLADADLANLGKDTTVYLASSEKFMRELNGGQLPSKDKQIAFWKSNVGLLTHHQYYTEEARLRYPNQQANLEVTRGKLEELMAT